MSPQLQLAIDAAKAGGKVAASYFQKPITVEKKKDKTFVTIADKETEKEIIRFISKKYPDAKFLGEESGGSIAHEEFWIIDPIDGTRSFVHGINTWCILIALVKNKEVVLGVCYYPLLNELFYAEEGQGTYHNDKKVSVSKVSNLSDAFVCYGSLKYFPNKQAIIELAEKCESIRSPEATYGSCHVIRGAMDAQIDVYGKLWDFAPIKILIEEAGGKITRLNGNPWEVDLQEGAIVSNGLIQDQILEIFNRKD